MPDGPTRGSADLFTTFWMRVPSDITCPEGPSRRTVGALGASNWTLTPSKLTIPDGPTTAALTFSSGVSAERTLAS